MLCQIVAISDAQRVVLIKPFELAADERLTEHIAAIHPTESVGVVFLLLTFTPWHDYLSKILQQRRAPVNLLIIGSEQAALATAAQRFRCLRAVAGCFAKRAAIAAFIPRAVRLRDILNYL